MMTCGEYLLHNGAQCPFCHSEHIDVEGNIEVNGPTATQKIYCYTCRKSWKDLYTLTGFKEQI